MFSSSFFITSSHLIKSRGWTAHSTPEPAGGRGHLVIRHSCFSPRTNGLRRQQSHPAALWNRKSVQSFKLISCFALPDRQACQILVNACYIWRWWRLERLVNREGRCLRRGTTFLAQLAATYRTILEMKQAQKKRREHKVIWSLLSIGRITSPCTVETVRGPVMRLLVTQGTQWGTSNIQIVDSKITVIQPVFQ